MKIEVTSMGQEIILILKEGSTGEDLLHALNLLPDGVLIVHNNTPIPYTNRLKNGDRLKIIRVASGG
jgi:sulfur carrier protein ThiS